MFSDFNVALYDIVNCISNTIDLSNPKLVDHHKNVAYIAMCLAEELNFPKNIINDIILASLLHDCGALTTKERLELLDFDFERNNKHSFLGYQLLKTYKPFENISLLVKNHHIFWKETYNSEDNLLYLASHLIHFADRISVSISLDNEILNKIEKNIDLIKSKFAKGFNPKFIDAFIELSKKEYFWFDLISDKKDQLFLSSSNVINVNLGLNELLDLSQLFCRLIDFRTRFTATHSNGVSSTAYALGKLVGFSEKECTLLKISGLLHDFGKLSISNDILEKPDKLNENEFNIIKSHTYHSYRILENIEQLQQVNLWASLHHEKLDGSGYPFHYKADDIPLGARVLCVCDIFTALAEDRPYRKGMSDEEILEIILREAKNHKLDENVVITLVSHFEELNDVRKEAQQNAIKEYQSFWEEYNSVYKNDE